MPVPPPPPPLPHDRSLPALPSGSIPSLATSTISLLGASSTNSGEHRVSEDEHARIISQENKKRKQPAQAFGVNKAVKIKAFCDDDDEDEIPTKTTTTHGANISISNSSSNRSSSSINSSQHDIHPEISEDKLRMIKKTASWALENPDKLSLLVERSKSEKELSFLSERHTPAGRAYLDEVNRLKAEREVNDVFHGSSFSMPVVSQPQHSSYGTMGNFVPPINNGDIEEAKMRAAMLAASRLSAGFSVNTNTAEAKVMPLGSSAHVSVSEAKSDLPVTIKKEKRSRWGEAPKTEENSIAESKNPFDEAIASDKVSNKSLGYQWVVVEFSVVMGYLL
jgi:hypothetical protein